MLVRQAHGQAREALLMDSLVIIYKLEFSEYNFHKSRIVLTRNCLNTDREGADRSLCSMK